MKRILFIPLLLLLALACAAQNTYLQIPNVPGDEPEGQPVLGFSWGLTNVITSISGGGGSTVGKTNVSDISLMMTKGKMSVELIRNGALGLYFPKAEIRFFDNSRRLYYKIILSDVQVSSIQQGSSCANSNCPDISENVTLRYKKIRIEDITNNKIFEYDVAAVIGQ